MDDHRHRRRGFSPFPAPFFRRPRHGGTWRSRGSASSRGRPRRQSSRTARRCSGASPGTTLGCPTQERVIDLHLPILLPGHLLSLKFVAAELLLRRQNHVGWASRASQGSPQRSHPALCCAQSLRAARSLTLLPCQEGARSALCLASSDSTFRSGLVSQLGIGQSPFMWRCRAKVRAHCMPMICSFILICSVAGTRNQKKIDHHPLQVGVRTAFAAIWDASTDQLVTGFDSCAVGRNLWRVAAEAQAAADLDIGLSVYRCLAAGIRQRTTACERCSEAAYPT